MADADLDLAVDGILWSAFGTTGQRCTACSRLVVRGVGRDDLVGRLADRARACASARASSRRTDVGPLINAGALAKGRRLRGRRDGRGRPTDRAAVRGRPATACSTATSSSPRSSTACSRWTASRRRRSSDRCCRVIRVAATTRRDGGQLDALRPSRRASTRATRTPPSARCATSTTGIVYVNAGTIGAETHLPFGGMKQTGNGHREAGHVALDTFTEWKSIYVDYSGRLQRAQIDNSKTPTDESTGHKNTATTSCCCRSARAGAGPSSPRRPTSTR